MFSTLVFAYSLLYALHGVFGCDMGWTQSRDKCYIQKKESATFETNRMWCKSINATMVSIHSEAELDFLRSFVDAYNWRWLGCKYNARGSPQFVWEDGSDYDYKTPSYHNLPSYNEVQGLVMESTVGWAFFALSIKNYQMCQKYTFIHWQVLQNRNETIDNLNRLEDRLMSLKSNLTGQIELNKEQTLNFTKSIHDVEHFIHTTQKQVDTIARETQASSASIIEIRQIYRALNDSIDEQQRLQSLLASLVHNLTGRIELNKEQTLNLTESVEDVAHFMRSIRNSVNEMSETLDKSKPRRCPLGWEHFNDNCYIESNSPLSFPKAENWCQSLNASMLRIMSGKENAVLKTKISGNTWMGGTQSYAASNHFNWTQFNPVEYSNFTDLSECIPGCGLVLQPSGQWSFDYTHGPSHKKLAMCQKLTDEKLQEMATAKQATQREERLEAISRNVTQMSQSVVGFNEYISKDLNDTLNHINDRLASLSSTFEGMIEKLLYIFIGISVILFLLFSSFSYYLFNRKRITGRVSYSKNEQNLEIFDMN